MLDIRKKDKFYELDRKAIRAKYGDGKITIDVILILVFSVVSIAFIPYDVFIKENPTIFSTVLSLVLFTLMMLMIIVVGFIALHRYTGKDILIPLYILMFVCVVTAVLAVVFILNMKCTDCFREIGLGVGAVLSSLTFFARSIAELVKDSKL